MTTYRVVIIGLKADQDPDEVLQRLAAIFKQPVERLQALITGSRTVVKRGVDIALAAKMQAAIEAAGCEVVVEPEVSEVPLTSANQPTQRLDSSVRSAPKIEVPPVGLGRPMPSPSLGKSKIIRYGGGFILLCLAFIAVAGIYAMFRNGPPIQSATAPTATPRPTNAVGNSGGGGGPSSSSVAVKEATMLAEREAKKLAANACTTFNIAERRVLKEGLMHEQMTDKDLPAAVVEVSGLCVNAVLASKEPFTYWVASAYDAEFGMIRGIAKAFQLGTEPDDGPTGKKAFDQYVATHVH